MAEIMALRQKRQEQNRKAFSKLVLPIAIFGIVILVISFVVIRFLRLLTISQKLFELLEYLVLSQSVVKKSGPLDRYKPVPFVCGNPIQGRAARAKFFHRN